MVTYGGTSGDVVTYNAAVAGAVKQANIKPAEMYLQSLVPRGAIERSKNLSEGAFAGATQHVVENMHQSMCNKYEAQCFYGGVGLGTIASVAGNVLTISTASWAPGIWVGGEGMKLDIYTGTSKDVDGCSITAVDLLNRTITVNAAGAAAVGDVIFEYGAYDNEFIGVHKMLTTTSGNIFGQSVSTYSLWRGNVFAVGSAALSFAKVSKAIALAVAKGVRGTLTLFVNPSSWSDLLTEQTAQRTFHEGGMSVYDNGAKKILFHSQNGDIEIRSSTFVKEGNAYALDMSTFLRIGSTDITFEDPNKPGKYLEPLTSSNAYQMICYTDSALFCSALGKNIAFTGIVNS